jgi:hypothetical protein
VATRVDSPSRLAGSADIKNPVLLARQLVIIDEELLKLPDEWFAEVVDVFHGSVAPPAALSSA